MLLKCHNNKQVVRHLSQSNTERPQGPQAQLKRRLKQHVNQTSLAQRAIVFVSQA